MCQDASLRDLRHGHQVLRPRDRDDAESTVWRDGDLPPHIGALKRDPLEAEDLAEAEPEKRKELAAALEAQLRRYAKVPWQPRED